MFSRSAPRRKGWEISSLLSSLSNTLCLHIALKIHSTKLNISEDMGDAGNWCLIESDPAVFTELVRDFGECEKIENPLKSLKLLLTMTFKITFDLLRLLFTGVSGLQVEELWSLAAEEFDNLG